MNQKYIYVNLKRFDVPREQGGVNNLVPIADWGKYIIDHIRPSISSFYESVEFGLFFPEMHILQAVEAARGQDNILIGSQSVFRRDVEPGKNFGALTSHRPASAISAADGKITIIGHCEERSALFDILTQAMFSFGQEVDDMAIQKFVNQLLCEQVSQAKNNGLTVLYCIGEKFEEKENWREVLEIQLNTVLHSQDLANIRIAYEPVWAIGPGRTPPNKEQIIEKARFIKSHYPNIPLVYGGGLKLDNAKMLASIEEIDGGLIALTRFTGDIGFYPDEYIDIVKEYMNP